jgi:hypothetical protein
VPKALRLFSKFPPFPIFPKSCIVPLDPIYHQQIRVKM